MEFRIRPVRESDAEALNVIRRAPGAFENVMGHPGERVEDSLAFLQCLGSNDYQFVAETEAGVVAGTAGLSVFGNPRMRHAATLGIIVHPDLQGMGAGNALMNTLMDMADNWLMLVRVELGVYFDNDRAIRLYEKFGFQREGVKRKSVIRNGVYIDEIIMARLRHCGEAP